MSLMAKAAPKRPARKASAKAKPSNAAKRKVAREKLVAKLDKGPLF